MIHKVSPGANELNQITHPLPIKIKQLQVTIEKKKIKSTQSGPFYQGSRSSRFSLTATEFQYMDYMDLAVHCLQKGH